MLSWSILEAMSAGCLLIGSDAAPVREVIDGTNGLLAPMFDVEAIADRIVDAFARPADYVEMRKAARQTILERYDIARVASPRLLAFVEQVTGGPLKPNRARAVA